MVQYFNPGTVTGKYEFVFKLLILFLKEQLEYLFTWYLTIFNNANNELKAFSDVCYS